MITANTFGVSAAVSAHNAGSHHAVHAAATAALAAARKRRAAAATDVSVDWGST
jgi:hypothetical protein